MIQRIKAMHDPLDEFEEFKAHPICDYCGSPIVDEDDIVVTERGQEMHERCFMDCPETVGFRKNLRWFFRTFAGTR